MKKLFCVLLCITVLYSLCAKDPDKKSVKFKTLIAKELKVSVWDDSGRFVLYGMDKGEWTPLLFNDDPPTSYIRFYRNEKLIPFGEGGAGRTAHIAIEGDSVVYEWRNEAVTVQLTYFFIKLGSGNFDTLKMEIKVSNTSDDPFMLNSLFCFDTILSETNDAHFYLPGAIAVNDEIEFSRDIVPSFITSGNDERSVMFLFDRADSVKPFRVFAANWKKVKEALGEYKVITGAAFDTGAYSLKDSALFVEYRDAQIKPGESTGYSFYLKANQAVAAAVPEVEPKPVDRALPPKQAPAEEPAPPQPVEDADDLHALDLSDLLKLLDRINKKLDSGAITQDDIDYSDKIIKEIESRK